ncbi:MAG: hypothetical protein V7K67_33845 [Nostoc sp.]|uniref:hypothetical protein n=1 Tax=Nostoc sp. TaxID=1180 RepID=UPI002FF4BA69
MTLTVMGVSIARAFAQRAIVIDGANGVQRSPAVGSLIYGSPIPTPAPVDPATRQNVTNSTPINPTIRDSTLVNPVIINNSWRRTPFSGGRCLTTSCSAPTRVIITYPR